MREFRRFLHAIGYKDATQKDREKVVALIAEMQKTARDRGMSEVEMATTYDVEALLDIYFETLDRRH